MRSNHREGSSRVKSPSRRCMRFRFIEENRLVLPIERLCQIMNVSSRSYRTYRSRPNQKWPLGDACITCRSTGAVSNRMKRDLAIRALNMAIALRRSAKGCVHHSDRGSQYCSHDYPSVFGDPEWIRTTNLPLRREPFIALFLL